VSSSYRQRHWRSSSAPPGRRSRVCPFTFSDYLELVDWTGRAIRENKPGFIPADVPPILTRLGVGRLGFSALIQAYGLWASVVLADDLLDTGGSQYSIRPL